MAGYISKFATGATIEAILDKANNSQSVSAAEKTTWNGKQNALTTAQLSAVNSGVTADMLATLANNGAKNFLKPIIESATVNDVTMTLQTNGTYALSGTSSAVGSKTRMFDMSALSALSGQTVKLTGGYSNSIRLGVYESSSASTPLYVDTGSGVEFTLTPELIASGDIRIAFLADADCTDVIISPMLRPASITDDTYIPYSMTNEKITKELTSTIPQLMVLNDDVNNYRISESISEHSGIKRWVCPSSTVRDSLSNLPTDFPSYPDFEIRFEQFKSNGIGMQTITGGSTSSLYIAKRFYKNNEFSAWSKVMFETNL